MFNRPVGGVSINVPCPVVFGLIEATSNDGFCVGGVCERSGMAAIVMTAKLNMIFPVALSHISPEPRILPLCAQSFADPYVDLMVGPPSSTGQTASNCPLASQDPSRGATRVAALALHRYA